MYKYSFSFVILHYTLHYMCYTLLVLAMKDQELYIIVLHICIPATRTGRSIHHFSTSAACHQNRQIHTSFQYVCYITCHQNRQIHTTFQYMPPEQVDPYIISVHLLHASRTGRFTHHFSTCHQNRQIHTSFQYIYYIPLEQVDSHISVHATRTGRFTHYFSTCLQNRQIHTSFQYIRQYYMPPEKVDSHIILLHLLLATRTGSFTHHFSILQFTWHQNRQIHTSFHYIPPEQVYFHIISVYICHHCKQICNYFFCSTLVSHQCRLICVIALHVFSIRTSTLASLHCMSSVRTCRLASIAIHRHTVSVCVIVLLFSLRLRPTVYHVIVC